MSDAAKEYSTTNSDEPAPDGFIRVRVSAFARVVHEHFAIRFQPGYHQAGEGMMMEAWVLDHMPTGFRVFGGPLLMGLGGSLEESCEAMAKSLTTMPIDWASGDRELLATLKGASAFATLATAAADDGESIEWPAGGA